MKKKRVPVLTQLETRIKLLEEEIFTLRNERATSREEMYLWASIVCLVIVGIFVLLVPSAYAENPTGNYTISE